jgi:hypothetical protein
MTETMACRLQFPNFQLAQEISFAIVTGFYHGCGKMVKLFHIWDKLVHPVNDYELQGDIPTHEKNGDEVFSD